MDSLTILTMRNGCVLCTASLGNGVGLCNTVTKTVSFCASADMLNISRHGTVVLSTVAADAYRVGVAEHYEGTAIGQQEALAYPLSCLASRCSSGRDQTCEEVETVRESPLGPVPGWRVADCQSSLAPLDALHSRTVNDGKQLAIGI